ncbi:MULTISPECIES: hypothetical protein [Natrialbaceae]|uniref:Uncharacterized protein n=2 Tax=Natrialbaceae TaxID=1644061 RepID=L9ZY23_9EURY|nr:MULTISPECIES: hypothetical protein [Natrialbaceae]ELY91410.1 hypothetical protein C484_10896 [Natrialba taiwanensis DSM 12281]
MDDENIPGYLLWRAWSNLRNIDKEQLSDDDREKVTKAIALLDEVEV